MYSVENIWFIFLWKYVDRNCYLNFNDIILILLLI